MHLLGLPQKRIFQGHIRKCGCRLENCRAYICAACISTPNCVCL